MKCKNITGNILKKKVKILKYLRLSLVAAMGTLSVWSFIFVLRLLKILLQFVIETGESFNNTEIILILFGFIFLTSKMCSLALNKTLDYLYLAEDSEEDDE